MTEHENHNIQRTDDFVLYGRVDAPEQYVDGASQLLLGFPVTKLLLHTVVAPRRENQPEVRKAVTQLTIPTLAAIELANLILGVCKESEEQLSRSLDEDGVAKLKALISNINVQLPQGYKKD